jgi:hypothetical protein
LGKIKGNNMKNIKNSKNAIKFKTVKCIPVTDLIPLSIPFAQIWTRITEDITVEFPFLYGSNKHSLVSPIDFANHCEEVFEVFEGLKDTRYKKFIKKIRSIPQNVYIDLEN